MMDYLQSEMMALKKVYESVQSDLPQRRIDGFDACRIYKFPPRQEGASYVSQEIYLVDALAGDGTFYIAYEVRDREAYENELAKHGRASLVRFWEDDDSGSVWAIVGLKDFLVSVPLMDIRNYLIRSTPSGRLLYAKQVLGDLR